MREGKERWRGGRHTEDFYLAKQQRSGQRRSDTSAGPALADPELAPASP